MLASLASPSRLPLPPPGPARNPLLPPPVQELLHAGITCLSIAHRPALRVTPLLPPPLHRSCCMPASLASPSRTAPRCAASTPSSSTLMAPCTRAGWAGRSRRSRPGRRPRPGAHECPPPPYPWGCALEPRGGGGAFSSPSMPLIHAGRGGRGRHICTPPLRHCGGVLLNYARGCRIG